MPSYHRIVKVMSNELRKYKLLCGKCGHHGRKPRIIGQVVWKVEHGHAEVSPALKTHSRGGTRIEWSLSRPGTFIEMLDAFRYDRGETTFRIRCVCMAQFEIKQRQLTATFEEIVQREGPAAVAGIDVGTFIKMISPGEDVDYGSWVSYARISSSD